jgi:hypothetical protein
VEFARILLKEQMQTRQPDDHGDHQGHRAKQDSFEQGHQERWDAYLLNTMSEELNTKVRPSIFLTVIFPS